MEKRGESVEAKGRTVEEAIENGLAQMGLAKDDVEVEVLNRGSRGVFGIGAEDARVLLTRVAPKPAPPRARQPEVVEKIAPKPRPTPEPAPKPTPAARPAPEPAARVAPEPQPAPRPRPEAREDWTDGEEGVPEAPTEDVERIAANALATLLKQMSMDARVVAKSAAGFMVEGNNPPPIVLDIEGDDLGVLIGRRGETLGALQYLVRLIVNHQTRHWYNIVVDVEGYKERRERQLRQLAERMAERVVATQRPVTLEAMPPYERRIVHLALREHAQVTTHSIGEGDSRKVMIILRQ